MSMRGMLGGLVMTVGLAVCTPADADAQGRQRDVLTREEVLQSAHRDLDLYQAIRNLRPHFLNPPRGVRTLGGTMPSPLLIVVDGTRQSGHEVLRELRANQIAEARYLEPSRSQDAYGLTGNGGAIVIKLYKEDRP
jgi:hypothetical protein